MSDPLPIIPICQPLSGGVRLPGSKSITNRALILAALAEGKTRLEGALFSRDTRIMLEALQRLGFTCTSDEAGGVIELIGLGGRIPLKTADLNVGNAGTAARFLSAFLAAQPGGTYHLDGDLAMRDRPMAGLVDALIGLGAAEFKFHGKEGHFPFTLYSKGFQGGEVEVDASASSQILSALLMAASSGDGETVLKVAGVRPAYVGITRKMRAAFGAPLSPSEEGALYHLEPLSYRPPEGGVYGIEPDLSAASYFLALTLIHGGSLILPNIGAEPLQGDARFAAVLSIHGLRVDAAAGEWRVSCPNPLAETSDHLEIDFNAFSDTFLTYAAIAPLLEGSVRIVGIGHTRRQETDRIAGMANELSKLGQLEKEEPNALTIMAKPNELRARALRARAKGRLLEVETYEDHRFAMSFGILGSFDLLEDGAPWLAIKDPGCCGKTFPGFFDTLDQLRVSLG